MKRRTVLTVGIAAGAIVALAGATIALLAPGRREGRLTDAGRTLFAAVARAVLDGLLPADPAALAAVLDAHLARVQDTISGMPPTVQAEIDELVTIMASAPGRLALAGLGTDWQSASVPDVTSALQSMRASRLALRQQAFHALRDLTNGSYFAAPDTWSAIGYPGQRTL